VLTVGAIKGGVRENIIPDSVEMRGTIRTFNEAMRDDIHERVRDTAESISRASRATCEVCISKNYAVTVNDAELTAATVPTLERVAGAARVMVVPKITGSEDFSFYQHVAPGFFYFVGITPPGQDPKTAPSNHSPLFFIDESALQVALRSLTQVAVDWLEAQAPLRAAA
jgi:amidohydrolase